MIVSTRLVLPVLAPSDRVGFHALAQPVAARIDCCGVLEYVQERATARQLSALQKGDVPFKENLPEQEATGEARDVAVWCRGRPFRNGCESQDASFAMRCCSSVNVAPASNARVSSSNHRSRVSSSTFSANACAARLTALRCDVASVFIKITPCARGYARGLVFGCFVTLQFNDPMQPVWGFGALAI